MGGQKYWLDGLAFADFGNNSAQKYWLDGFAYDSTADGLLPVQTISPSLINIPVII